MARPASAGQRHRSPSGPAEGPADLTLSAWPGDAGTPWQPVSRRQATPDTEALAAVVAGLRPGQQVPVSVTKADGSTTTIHVTLGQLPGS